MSKNKISSYKSLCAEYGRDNVVVLAHQSDELKRAGLARVDVYMPDVACGYYVTKLIRRVSGRPY